MKTSFKMILWVASIMLLATACEASSIRKDYKEMEDETNASTILPQDMDANSFNATSSEKQSTTQNNEEEGDTTVSNGDSQLEYESSTVEGLEDDSSESEESDESAEDETGKPLSSTSIVTSEDEQTETPKPPLEADSDSSSSSDAESESSEESDSSSSSESNENTDASSSSSSSEEDDIKLSNKHEAPSDKRKPEKFLKTNGFGKTGGKLSKKDKSRKMI